MVKKFMEAFFLFGCHGNQIDFFLFVKKLHKMEYLKKYNRYIHDSSVYIYVTTYCPHNDDMTLVVKGQGHDQISRSNVKFCKIFTKYHLKVHVNIFLFLLNVAVIISSRRNVYSWDFYDIFIQKMFCKYHKLVAMVT